MGMLAEYMMIDTETLDSLMELENDDLVNRICELEEEQKFESEGIDKLWDALHFFLTGVTASEPIEGDKLSEAVVGVHPFSYDEEADFITCTENDELAEIIEALEKFDFQARADKFEPKMMGADIYPGGINEEDKASLLEEIKGAIDCLIAMYKQALKENNHVIVSIL